MLVCCANIWVTGTAIMILGSAGGTIYMLYQVRYWYLHMLSLFFFCFLQRSFVPISTVPTHIKASLGLLLKSAEPNILQDLWHSVHFSPQHHIDRS